MDEEGWVQGTAGREKVGKKVGGGFGRLREARFTPPREGVAAGASLFSLVGP